MKLVTDEQIAAARAQAEQSVAALAQARSELGSGTIGPQTAQNYAVATAKSERDAATVVMLADQQSAQRVELQARAERERHIWAELDTAERELAELRARAATTKAARESAQLVEIDAAAAYDAGVGRVRELLLTHRLMLSDVADDAEHATGAAQRHGVRLRGRFSDSLDPAAWSAFSEHRVQLSVFGRTVTTERLACMPGVAALANRSDGLLDDVTELPARPQPSRLRVPTVRLGRGEPASPRPELDRRDLERMLHPRESVA